MAGAEKIGIVGGAGWLGKAIASAMLEANLINPSNLTLSFRSNKYDGLNGVNWTQNNQNLADNSDVIIISVRPEDWPSISLDAKGKLVISVMAGIGINALAERHNTNRVVRVLPNAAAEIQKSFTVWYASDQLNDNDRALVRAIFDACGTEDEAKDEREIDYFTALTGSGPAFPALLAEAMTKHAIEFGISPKRANKAARAVIMGAAGLLEKNNQTAAEILNSFMEYQGTTAAALEAMRAEGFDKAVASGISSGFSKALTMGQNS